MSIKVSSFGEYAGRPVEQAQLESSDGVSVKIISYGAIVREWLVPVHNKKRNVVLGFDNMQSYLVDPVHMGAIVGRVANRIGKAQFIMAGRRYELPANVGVDHLHGGPEGLSKKNWNLSTDEKKNSVTLKLHSPEGEMGYPADAHFTVNYQLQGSILRIEMTALVSALTPISMVQHNYFNLMGDGNVFDHHLQVAADRYTVLSDELITTGELRTVDGSKYDFRKPRNLRDSRGREALYDINFALNEKFHSTSGPPAAQVFAPDRSLHLKLWTDRPGLQLYNGQKTGLCLEDQMFPDAVNKPHFPSIYVSPEKPYSHVCEIEIKA